VSAPVAEQVAAVFTALGPDDVPERALRTARLDLLDAAGLCIAARRSDYVAALLAGWDGEGSCTALGHDRPLDAAGAAVVNGTAIHGEDFDDTLEGAPIRVGAMVIPAVLAAAERFGTSGRRTLLGIACGLEMVCRINHVAPGAIHRAGFHPVGVLGPFGATVGVGVALGLDARQLALALGVAGSLSSGISEFLTAGAWTKRLHPGWAASSGLRAALLGRAGFVGPTTVLDGRHSLFNAFAPSAVPDHRPLLDGLGTDWLMEDIAFKPYACGTMIHPYVDCMRRLRRDGVRADEIARIVCPTSEGLVARLWEPLHVKHRPPSGYAAKFSMPFGMAVGFFDDDAGLAQFTDERARDPEVLALAAKISYVLDPDNEYPDNYTGHLRVTLTDGRTLAYDQPHLRGGRREPLTEAHLLEKFRGNVDHGGLDAAYARRLADWCLHLDEHPDLTGLQELRS
jgi:2-methylcitrate dehydratase PrpD